MVLTSPTGEKFCYVLQLQFICSNNATEYEGQLHGLRLSREMGISRIQCYGDSDLISQQVSGTLHSKDPMIAAYRREVDRQADFLVDYQVDHVDRSKTKQPTPYLDSAQAGSSKCVP